MDIDILSTLNLKSITLTLPGTHFCDEPIYIQNKGKELVF